MQREKFETLSGSRLGGATPVAQAILIRVTPENFDQWRAQHDGQREARQAYGMTDGPVYRDEKNPKVALVHLNLENLERAMQWFKSDAFRSAAGKAGNVQREIWIAQSPPRP
jgi:hypothetical protein